VNCKFGAIRKWLFGFSMLKKMAVLRVKIRVNVVGIKKNSGYNWFYGTLSIA
jgi:hypothetical protein